MVCSVWLSSHISDQSSLKKRSNYCCRWTTGRGPAVGKGQWTHCAYFARCIWSRENAGEQTLEHDGLDMRQGTDFTTPNGKGWQIAVKLHFIASKVHLGSSVLIGELCIFKFSVVKSVWSIGGDYRPTCRVQWRAEPMWDRTSVLSESDECFGTRLFGACALIQPTGGALSSSSQHKD